MRRIVVSSAFAVFATMTLVANANAVPSFTRQTGLTCNQCHVTWSPVPDFTFTGKKFRLNGYRAPYVAERIEAGEEGALNGKRMTLGLQNIFSLRFRNTLLSQSKSPSDASGPSNPAGSVSSTPGTTISWFYVGGIGEHIGIWNEFYLTNTAGGAGTQRFRLESFDEFDVKFVVNPGYDNIVGFAVTTQAITCLAGFCPFSTGVPNHLQRGGFGTAGAAYVNLAAYALIKDRVLLGYGVQPGEDNYSFDGMNHQLFFGYAFSNSDYNQIWYVGFLKAGNDAIPMTTSVSMAPDRSSLRFRDAIRGISATRGVDADGNPLGAYRAADLGDFVRTKQELYYSFIDRGPHSLHSGVGFSWSRDRYNDGAEVEQSAVGIRARYLYDRTYGFEWRMNKSLTYEFRDRNGVVHPIENSWSDPIRLTGMYRPAMNFAMTLGLRLRNGRDSGLDPDPNIEFRKGWSWSIGFDFMF